MEGAYNRKTSRGEMHLTVNRISTSELALTSHFVGPDLIRRLTPRFLLFNHKNEFDFQIRKLVSRRRAQLRDVTSFL